MPRAKNCPFEAKKGLLGALKGIFSRKGSLGPEKGPNPGKNDLFSAQKGLFKDERVYFEPPRALSKQAKALSETEMDPLEPKRSLLELKGPSWRRKRHI